MNKAIHEALERYIKNVVEDDYLIKPTNIDLDFESIVQGIFDGTKKVSDLGSKNCLIVIGPCALSSPEKMYIDFALNHGQYEKLQLINALVSGELRDSVKGALGKLPGKSINIASNMGWG